MCAVRRIDRNRAAVSAARLHLVVGVQSLKGHQVAAVRDAEGLIVRAAQRVGNGIAVKVARPVVRQRVAAHRVLSNRQRKRRRLNEHRCVVVQVVQVHHEQQRVVQTCGVIHFHVYSGIVTCVFIVEAGGGAHSS